MWLKLFFKNLKKEIDKMDTNATILIAGLELAFIQLIEKLRTYENVLWWIIIANIVIIFGWIITAVIDTIIEIKKMDFFDKET